ncbi:hypothetical protein FE257_012397 [Aspergillus nanangensis]|uniref:Zn(2)-C6 fungal-type domain-containing protein n=1 Tax=Aspergillus nanangensis TaxID=2582783 RepID=A0AAD4CUV9_ASPNN|nr:hypothetical protein FE257_012397 [Aspergillus nanangensis]
MAYKHLPRPNADPWSPSYSSRGVMTQTAPLGKKPTACVPCHERKVRCDSSLVGVPCTRCVTKQRIECCSLVERGGRSSLKRKRITGGDDLPSTPDGSKQRQEKVSGGQQFPIFGEDSRLLTPATDLGSQQQQQEQQVTWPQRVSLENLAEDQPTDPPPGSVQYMLSEDDAHLQTLRQMGDDDPIIRSPVPLSSSDQDQQVIEYYGELNSISILSEVLGHAQRRLIRIDLPGPAATGAIQKELARLKTTDVEYLKANHVHEFPAANICHTFLHLFLKHVYPYTPILNRQHLLDDYTRGTCSSFLLWSIFANVVPYASRETLLDAGYTEYPAAQKEYFARARLLYDFGCEKGQLSLLQGSVLLSSFQFSVAPDKDFRFWFHNAVRIATQMGFHQQDIGSHLDTETYHLARRIWWVLYSRDVWFCTVGFENARRMQGREFEIPLPDVQDWGCELQVSPRHKDLMPEINSTQRHFLRANCQLAIFGARFLSLLQPNRLPLMTAVHELTRDLAAWRSSLPEDLVPDRVGHWTSANAWVLFLWAMGLRLECWFYRAVRQRLKGVEDTDASWAHDRLRRCIFELDTVLERAIVNQVARYCPPSFLVCVSHLLTLQLEIALDARVSEAQRLKARTQIHMGLDYLCEVGDRWLNGKWTYRVFDSVTRRTGIAMAAPKSASRWTGTAGSHADPGVWPDSQTERPVIESAALDLNEDGSILPDRWIEELLTQNLASGLDDGLFNSIFAT